MKRYNNLYEKICSIENITLAHKKARKGKLHYKEVKKIDNDPDNYFFKLSKILEDDKFVNSKYKKITKITDNGKKREIFKLPYYPDRIVQHTIMNILEPIWKSVFIRDTYSSLQGRGIHDGVNRIKKALKDKEGTTYCLKLDVVKFYPSINNEILKTIIRRKIKDIRLLKLIDTIIDSKEGIPIGNYISQYFGNLYLSDFDHYIKEQLDIKYYFRYCDDLVILHKDKNFLRELKEKITIYLKDKLKLEIKSNWQIFPIEIRGIDFLGYRFYHNYTLLRKSIAQKFKKRIQTILKSTCPVEKQNSLMSYKGWFKFADCYNFYDKYIRLIDAKI